MSSGTLWYGRRTQMGQLLCCAAGAGKYDHGPISLEATSVDLRQRTPLHVDPTTGALRPFLIWPRHCARPSEARPHVA